MTNEPEPQQSPSPDLIEKSKDLYNENISNHFAELRKQEAEWLAIELDKVCPDVVKTAVRSGDKRREDYAKEWITSHGYWVKHSPKGTFLMQRDKIVSTFKPGEQKKIVVE